jgi:hypothetical protein
MRILNGWIHAKTREEGGEKNGAGGNFFYPGALGNGSKKLGSWRGEL